MIQTSPLLACSYGFWRHGLEPNQADHGLMVEAPAVAIRFVETTMAQALDGTLEEVVAAFFFGRENVIPSMFQRLLARVEGVQAPRFLHYLERHIAVDADEHGPAARQLLERVIGHDPEKRERAWMAAGRSLEARIQFFDGVLDAVGGSFIRHHEELTRPVYADRV